CEPVRGLFWIRPRLVTMIIKSQSAGPGITNSLRRVDALPSWLSSGSLFRKFLFALLCAAVAAFYAHAIHRSYRASILANSDATQLPQAIELELSRADYHHRYGRYLYYLRQDVDQAVQHYRRATELNPRSAAAWLDLALAHQALGQSSQQAHALQ